MLSICILLLQGCQPNDVSHQWYLSLWLSRPDHSPVGPPFPQLPRSDAPQWPPGGQFWPGGTHLCSWHRLEAIEAVRFENVWQGACYTHLHNMYMYNVQWNISVKDLRIKDTSLVRTLPVVPATLRSALTSSEIKTPLLIRTLHVVPRVSVVEVPLTITKALLTCTWTLQCS